MKFDYFRVAYNARIVVPSLQFSDPILDQNRKNQIKRHVFFDSSLIYHVTEERRQNANHIEQTYIVPDRKAGSG